MTERATQPARRRTGPRRRRVVDLEALRRKKRRDGWEHSGYKLPERRRPSVDPAIEDYDE